MDSKDHIMSFGKYKGLYFEQIPFDYVLWLASIKLSNNKSNPIYDPFEELVDNIWNNKDSKCGCTTGTKGHSVFCSMYCLDNDRDKTREKTIKLIFEDKVSFNEVKYLKPWIWVYVNYQATVSNAKKYVEESEKCYMCYKKLVPIGNSRKNGKSHNDWEDRKLHKKCWLSLGE